MAESLQTHLSWVPSCENGFERIVEFFQEIDPLEEYYYSLENLYFFSPKKRKLLSKLKIFIEKVNYTNRWNRTKEGEIPSDETIFIYVDKFTTLLNEEDNLNIHTQSVKRLINQSEENQRTEENLRVKEELKAFNKIASSFMEDNYEILKEAVKDFR